MDHDDLTPEQIEQWIAAVASVDGWRPDTFHSWRRCVIDAWFALLLVWRLPPRTDLDLIHRMIVAEERAADPEDDVAYWTAEQKRCRAVLGYWDRRP